MAKDTTSGSKKVKITNQEVLLKNKSFFKTSVGDEAGCAQKKGVITSKTKGKVYFTAWSMDVKFEGENVVRHLDLTTHNHGSATNTAPWPHLDSQAIKPGGPCFKEKKKIAKKCNPEDKWKENCPERPPKGKLSDQAYIGPYSQKIKKNACLTARRCMLVNKSKDKTDCCDGQTGHHVIDDASFRSADGTGLEGWDNYEYSKAPCVCCEGGTYHKGTHSEMHVRVAAAASRQKDENGMWSRQKATKAGAKALRKTFPRSGCSQKCIEAQLNNYHDKAKSSDPEQPIRATTTAEAPADYRAIASEDMGFGLAPF
jgi:hypothetical protein